MTRPEREVTEWRIEKVAALTRDGWSAPQIASHIGIAERTVVRYRSQMRYHTLPTKPEPNTGLGWQRKAVCSPADADLYTATEKPDVLDLKRLQLICDSCPVQKECAAHALDAGVSGLWAGTWVPVKGTGRTSARDALGRKVYAA